MTILLRIHCQYYEQEYDPDYDNKQYQQQAADPHHRYNGEPNQYNDTQPQAYAEDQQAYEELPPPQQPLHPFDAQQQQQSQHPYDDQDDQNYNHQSQYNGAVDQYGVDDDQYPANTGEVQYTDERYIPAAGDDRYEDDRYNDDGEEEMEESENIVALDLLKDIVEEIDSHSVRSPYADELRELLTHPHFKVGASSVVELGVIVLCFSFYRY